MPNVRLALDKSLRHYDADGRLHVERTNISKAMVSPYLGSEIPECETLGLDPQKIYMLLRDPEELAKGAATFNNLQLLKIHKPVDVNDSAQNLTVGSIGSDVEFRAPYLQSSLCIWDASAIAGVESEAQAELSSAYRYRADMTPGTFEGAPYDGVMRDIVGNHVALVEVGRAGSDVVVADSNPFIKKEHAMPTAKGTRLSSKAIAVAGALRAYLTPKLAQDQAVGSLRELVKDVKSATFEKQKPVIVQRITAAVKGKLAQDADLADLDKVLDALCGTEDANMVGDDLDLAAMDGEEDEDDMEDDPDNPGQKRKKVKAMDEPPPTEGTPKPPTKAAMDAAIGKARTEAIAEATKAVEALHVAREEVQAIVGKVALDSADAVYKFALDHLKIDTTGVHPSAYRSMVKLASQTRPSASVGTLIAQDAAVKKNVTTAFPHVGRFKHA